MHPTRFWTGFAAKTFPQHAWALAEIDPYLEIDALPVELELVTGASAYTMRNQLLIARQQKADKDQNGMIFTESAWIVGLNDARLAAWCSLAVVRAAILRVEQRVTLQLTQLESSLSTFEAWCAGEETRSQVDREIEVVTDLSGRYYPDSAYNLSRATRYIAELTKDRTADKDAVSSRSFVSEMWRYYRGDFVKMDRLKRTYLDAMMTLPAAE